MSDPVIISPAARHDLSDIWDYISRDNEDRATEFIQFIYRQCLVLVDMPRMGKNRASDLCAGIRSYPVGKYMIYYRSRGARIEIVRILHSARDARAAFEEA